MNHKISRVKRSKRDAQNSYDQISRWYDWLTSGEIGLTEECLRLLAVKEGERVLEIGPGTGRALAALAFAAGVSGWVCGLDLSSGMLGVAQSRLQEAGLANRAQLLQGDAAHLPFLPASFDAVFASFTLELFDTPEIALVLRECRRVLRENGRLAVVSLSKNGRSSISRSLYELAHVVLPRYVDCRPIYVRSALEEAGFEVRDLAQRYTWGLPVDIVVAGR